MLINSFYSAMSDEEIELTARAASTNDLPQNSSSTKYIRSLRLSSEKLKKLGLRKGANEARFSITTKFQVIFSARVSP